MTVGELQQEANLRRNRSQEAAFVMESLRILGIDAHPHSRLCEMARVMSGEGVIERTNPAIHIAEEAIRDLTILAHVFERLGTDTHNKAYVAKVKEATKDSVFPQLHGNLARGRNAQSELLVAANCAAAGFHPVTFEKPDIACVLDGVKYGIAVKRLKSPKTIKERIRKAAEQVQNARKPGFVALDCTQALNPDNARVVLRITEHEFALSWSKRLFHFFKPFNDWAQEFVRGRGVLGIIIQDHIILETAKRLWSLQSMNFWVGTARTNQRRGRQLDAFKTAYGRGLPNFGRI